MSDEIGHLLTSLLTLENDCRRQIFQEWEDSNQQAWRHMRAANSLCLQLLTSGLALTRADLVHAKNQAIHQMHMQLKANCRGLILWYIACKRELQDMRRELVQKLACPVAQMLLSPLLLKWRPALFHKSEAANPPQIHYTLAKCFSFYKHLSLVQAAKAKFRALDSNDEVIEDAEILLLSSNLRYIVVSNCWLLNVKWATQVNDSDALLFLVLLAISTALQGARSRPQLADDLMNQVRGMVLQLSSTFEAQKHLQIGAYWKRIMGRACQTLGMPNIQEETEYGIALLHLGRYAQALAVLKAVLHTPGISQPLQCFLMKNIGLAHYARPAKQVKWCTRALAISSGLHDDLRSSQALLTYSLMSLLRVREAYDILQLSTAEIRKESEIDFFELLLKLKNSCTESVQLAQEVTAVYNSARAELIEPVIKRILLHRKLTKDTRAYLFTSLAQIYTEQQRLREAENCVQRALRMEVGWALLQELPRTRLVWAALLMETGEYKQAEALLLPLLLHFKDADWKLALLRAAMLLSSLYLRTYRLDEAQQLLTEALPVAELVPQFQSSITIFSLCSQVFTMQSKLPEAQLYLKRISSDSSPATHLAIGKHLIALGFHQEGQGFFEKVFTNSRSLFYVSEACLDLADLHEIRGDVDIAKQVLEKGLQLLAEFPTHPAVAQIRRRLETLQ